MAKHLFQIAEDRIRRLIPNWPCARTIRRPRWRHSGLHGPKVRFGWAVSKPEDPSNRSRDRRDLRTIRIQPLRHRGHLVDGELWHATWEGEESRPKAGRSRTGESRRGSRCRLACTFRARVRWRRSVLLGGGPSGKVRAVGGLGGESESSEVDQNKEQPTNETVCACARLRLLTSLPRNESSRQAQTQNQPPSPARLDPMKMLARWNDIGNKLVAMKKDFPGQIHFKCNGPTHLRPESSPRRRTDLSSYAGFLDQTSGLISGRASTLRATFFKTEADVVKFVQEAVADGAQVIQQQGDAGLEHTSKCFGPAVPQLLHLDLRHRAQRRPLWPACRLLNVRTTWCRRTRG